MPVFFTSLVILGPRRATLLMSAAPVITALFAWPVLGEVLSLTAITGIGITTAGIVWVSSEKRGTVRVERSGSLIAGALWGLGGIYLVIYSDFRAADDYITGVE